MEEIVQPLISVIVAEKDSARTIRKCLDSLLAQDYPRFEVIVVDDGSRDGTPGLLEPYAESIRIIRWLQSRGPSAARNAAAAEAAGELIAFTDGDCYAEPGWLSGLAKGFTAPDIAALGGRQVPAEDETAFGRHIFRFFNRLGFATDYVHGASSGPREVGHNPSCNVIYRKDVYLSLGGFLPGMWPGEDVEFDYRLVRAGYRILFDPRAVVCHYRPCGLRAFCGMMGRYGWAQGVLAGRYGLIRKVQLLPGLSAVFLAFFAIAPAAAAATAAGLLAAAFLFSGFDAVFALLLVPALLFWNMGFIRGIFGWRRVFVPAGDKNA